MYEIFTLRVTKGFIVGVMIMTILMKQDLCEILCAEKEQNPQYLKTIRNYLKENSKH